MSNPKKLYVRRKELLSKYVPLAPSTLHDLIRKGKFPPPIKLSDRVSAWKVSDVLAWLESKEQVAA